MKNYRLGLVFTRMVVVQAPGLDVVLGQLGVRLKAHRVGDNLDICVGKGLQLEVHFANLKLLDYLVSLRKCFVLPREVLMGEGNQQPPLC